MSNNNAPYFRFYVNDFIDSDSVNSMTLEEQGAYINVLSHLWKRSGNLKDCDQLCRRLLHCSLRKWKKIKQKFLDLGVLVLENGILFNRRLAQEFSIFQELCETNRKNALKSTKKVNKINESYERTLSHTDKDKDLCTRTEPQPISELIPDDGSDTIFYDLPKIKQISKPPRSTSTSTNNLCSVMPPDDFTIEYGMARSKSEDLEIPDIPILGGKRMVLGDKTIKWLKALAPEGLLGELIMDYKFFLLGEARHIRSRFPTIIKELIQWQNQAIEENKYGYGHAL